MTAGGPRESLGQKSVLGVGSDQHRGRMARRRVSWRLGAGAPEHSGLCHSYLRSSLKMQIPGPATRDSDSVRLRRGLAISMFTTEVQEPLTLPYGAGG